MAFWAHAAPSIGASFLASLVEFVEALTVVLAVGTTRGWRHALAGTGLALLSLAVLVAALGPALARIPLEFLQLVVGVLLLLFGLRWLRKAVLRAAGIVALHDETAVYARETQALGRPAGRSGSWDRAAVATAFNIVMLEGVEVVFIVIAIGAAGGLLAEASLGAAAALLLVVLLGLALHRPLARLPENELKFVVGGLLAGFGTFWTGEGLGFVWPGGDWAAPALALAYLLLGIAVVRTLRGSTPKPLSSPAGGVTP